MYLHTTGLTADTKGGAFCGLVANWASGEEDFSRRRADFNFGMLNIYPYTSGHLMVVPYAHLDALDKAEKAATDEMMDLVTSAQTAISEVYTPDGINLGMNLGKAAGAGVAGHYHMHLLPRWIGDVNFMTAIGQTRTIPETLTTTYEKLKGKI